MTYRRESIAPEAVKRRGDVRDITRVRPSLKGLFMQVCQLGLLTAVSVGLIYFSSLPSPFQLALHAPTAFSGGIHGSALEWVSLALWICLALCFRAVIAKLLRALHRYHEQKITAGTMNRWLFHLGSPTAELQVPDGEPEQPSTQVLAIAYSLDGNAGELNAFCLDFAGNPMLITAQAGDGSLLALSRTRDEALFLSCIREHFHGEGENLHRAVTLLSVQEARCA